MLEALREQLRCKEIWVVGANRYRNSDEDLPADLETNLDEHYEALNLPLDADRFITQLGAPVPRTTRVDTGFQGQCHVCEMILAIIGRDSVTSEVPMPILRRRAAPFFTNTQIARTRRPIGKSTIQHPTTPRVTTPDESPQIGGKAVDHTTITPHTTAGKAKTSAAIWNSIPMPLGLFPAGGAEIGPIPFSTRRSSFFADDREPQTSRYQCHNLTEPTISSRRWILQSIDRFRYDECGQ